MVEMTGHGAKWMLQSTAYAQPRFVIFNILNYRL